MGYRVVKKSSRSAVLIQYQRVTDGRTDVQPISITCFSIADARKKPKDQKTEFLFLKTIGFFPPPALHIPLHAMVLCSNKVSTVCVSAGMSHAQRSLLSWKSVRSVGNRLYRFIQERLLLRRLLLLRRRPRDREDQLFRLRSRLMSTRLVVHFGFGMHLQLPILIVELTARATHVNCCDRNDASLVSCIWAGAYLGDFPLPHLISEKI